MSEDKPYISPYDTEPKVLYTYSKIDYMDTLSKGSLWFRPTRMYNDIHENTMFVRPTSTNYQEVFDVETRVNEWLNARVCRCFTTDPTNALMWAHYAADHEGVCLGFRLDRMKESITDGQPLRHRKIRYSTEPPVSLASISAPEEHIHLLGGEIMNTKSIHWAYEKEYRVHTFNPTLAASNGGLIDVGVEAITDVIFGVKVKEDTLRAERRKLPAHVHVGSAEIDARALSYNMVIRTL